MRDTSPLARAAVALVLLSAIVLGAAPARADERRDFQYATSTILFVTAAGSLVLAGFPLASMAEGPRCVQRFGDVCASHRVYDGGALGSDVGILSLALVIGGLSLGTAIFLVGEADARGRAPASLSVRLVPNLSASARGAEAGLTLAGSF